MKQTIYGVVSRGGMVGPAGAAGVIGVRSVLVMSIACDVLVFNSQVSGFALDEECQSLTWNACPCQGQTLLPDY